MLVTTSEPKPGRRGAGQPWGVVLPARPALHPRSHRPDRTGRSDPGGARVPEARRPASLRFVENTLANVFFLETMH